MSREKTESLITNYQLPLSKAAAQSFIITADTTVTIDDQILGKPADAVEAREMLQTLRGRTHQVLTAITVSNSASGETFHELCVSDVPMRNYNEEDLNAYVASGDPLDKAGSYAIQNQTFHPVENFSHCYASVMGLPLCHLARILKKAHVEVKADVPTKCQEFTNYVCPIHQTILS
jgi:MAF protein